MKAVEILIFLIFLVAVTVGMSVLFVVSERIYSEKGVHFFLAAGAWLSFFILACPFNYFAEIIGINEKGSFQHSLWVAKRVVPVFGTGVLSVLVLISLGVPERFADAISFIPVVVYFVCKSSSFLS